MVWDHPLLVLDHLDDLWFQIAGTICNLRCNHCFISCSPENRALGMMTFEQFLPYLHEAIQLGVKEFYFTGGEPFANPDLLKVLEATLQVGPATVLTNATLFSWLCCNFVVERDVGIDDERFNSLQRTDRE